MSELALIYFVVTGGRRGTMEEVTNPPKAAVFKSFEEADRADKAYYLSLTPQQRLEIVTQLRALLYGPDDDSAPRLERVYRIVELPRR